MSSGKKVFTQAGEYLATFLVEQQRTLTDNQNLLDTINDINGTTTVNYTNDFQNLKNLTKEQTINYFKTELTKELNFIKVTNGEKELSLQNMVQYLYNELQWLDKLNQAQYEAVVEQLALNIADLFKKTGSMYRSFTMSLNILRNNIANLGDFSLDHFMGSTALHDTMYIRTSGNKILMCDGKGTSAKFYELIKASSVTTGNQATIGNILLIGGTEPDSPFTRIDTMHDLYSHGDIVMSDGKELKGTALKSRYADLAEKYTSDKDYTPGTLLQINTDGKSEVTEFNPQSGNICIGVVSDKPGFVLNEELQFNDSTKEDNKGSVVSVVLTGKSPVKVHGATIKGEILYSHPVYNGVAISVRPSLRKEYEKSNPLSEYIGVVLEINEEALDKYFDATFNGNDYNDINICYAKLG